VRGELAILSVRDEKRKDIHTLNRVRCSKKAGETTELLSIDRL